jgi:WASH complex subunit FAM21
MCTKQSLLLNTPNLRISVVDVFQNLLAQTHATEVALDSLMEQLRATSTDVSNVTNQFLCLSNTQFLENRVYDDDEKEMPPEEKKEEAKVRAEMCKL